MDSQIAVLARLIDPDVWVAREEDQTTIGARYELKTRRMESEQAAERILAAGYALVKLPEMVVNEDGQSTWPIPEIDRWADVFVRRSDGRISINAVSNPIETPVHALSLAAALTAAAQHVMEKRDA